MGRATTRRTGTMPSSPNPSWGKISFRVHRTCVEGTGQQQQRRRLGMTQPRFLYRGLTHQLTLLVLDLDVTSVIEWDLKPRASSSLDEEDDHDNDAEAALAPGEAAGSSRLKVTLDSLRSMTPFESEAVRNAIIGGMVAHHLVGWLFRSAAHTRSTPPHRLMIVVPRLVVVSLSIKLGRLHPELPG